MTHKGIDNGWSDHYNTRGVTKQNIIIKYKNTNSQASWQVSQKKQRLVKDQTK